MADQSTQNPLPVGELISASNLSRADLADLHHYSKNFRQVEQLIYLMELSYDVHVTGNPENRETLLKFSDPDFPTNHIPYTQHTTPPLPVVAAPPGIMPPPGVTPLLSSYRTFTKTYNGHLSQLLLFLDTGVRFRELDLTGRIKGPGVPHYFSVQYLEKIWEGIEGLRTYLAAVSKMPEGSKSIADNTQEKMIVDVLMFNLGELKNGVRMARGWIQAAREYNETLPVLDQYVQAVGRLCPVYYDHQRDIEDMVDEDKDLEMDQFGRYMQHARSTNSEEVNKMIGPGGPGKTMKQWCKEQAGLKGTEGENPELDDLRVENEMKEREILGLMHKEHTEFAVEDNDSEYDIKPGDFEAYQAMEIAFKEDTIMEEEDIDDQAEDQQNSAGEGNGEEEDLDDIESCSDLSSITDAFAEWDEVGLIEDEEVMIWELTHGRKYAGKLNYNKGAGDEENEGVDMDDAEDQQDSAGEGNGEEKDLDDNESCSDLSSITDAFWEFNTINPAENERWIEEQKRLKREANEKAEAKYREEMEKAAKNREGLESDEDMDLPEHIEYAAIPELTIVRGSRKRAFTWPGITPIGSQHFEMTSRVNCEPHGAPAYEWLKSNKVSTTLVPLGYERPELSEDQVRHLTQMVTKCKIDKAWKPKALPTERSKDNQDMGGVEGTVPTADEIEALQKAMLSADSPKELTSFDTNPWANSPKESSSFDTNPLANPSIDDGGSDQPTPADTTNTSRQAEPKASDEMVDEQATQEAHQNNDTKEASSARENEVEDKTDTPSGPTLRPPNTGSPVPEPAS